MAEEESLDDFFAKKDKSKKKSKSKIKPDDILALQKGKSKKKKSKSSDEASQSVTVSHTTEDVGFVTSFIVFFRLLLFSSCASFNPSFLTSDESILCA